MGLLYKPDWAETKQCYLAWWNHEALDRCILWVTAPRADVPDEPEPAPPSDPAARWTDLEFISRVNDYRFRHTFYGGEAFPVWQGGYCLREFIPAFLGAPLHLDARTGWMDPILTGEDLDCSALRIDPENRWWKFHLEFLRYASAQARGKAIPTIGAFGGCGDTLAALRGSERLLYDLMDRPDRVRAAEETLMDMWCKVYDTWYPIIREAAEGSTCWFEVWSPGKYYIIQNDFSYMISPQQFRDVFLPVLDRQTRFLDHCLYHLDGVGAFGHVPALCELPRLHGIQIVPGAGKPDALHYLDMLKYIQDRGKNLQIFLDPDRVEAALKELSSRGLMIMTWCKTETEARALLDNAKKWRRG